MTMAGYVGVGNRARKIKSIYVGVNGVARSVRKAYIGVNGKARLWYQKITELRLRVPAWYQDATTVGDYALFVGARLAGEYDYKVTAFNSNLIRHSPTDMSQPRRYLKAATVGDYAVIAGGYAYQNRTQTEFYDSNLVHTYKPKDTTLYGEEGSATATNAFALFTGFNTDMAFDVNLTQKDLGKLGRIYPCAGHIGEYALIAGGSVAQDHYVPVDTVDIYDSNLTKQTSTTLSSARTRMVSTSNGTYVLFGAGQTSENDSQKDGSTLIDPFNVNLVRVTPVQLSCIRHSCDATSVNGYSLFGGGGPDFSSSHDTVDAFNSNLVTQTVKPLTLGRSNLVATSIGQYALFGGGTTEIDNNEFTDIVDIYTF